MIKSPRLNRLEILSFVIALSLFAQTASELFAKEIPEALQPWKGWATWDDAERVCPTPYYDPKNHLCFWPSRLTLDVSANQSRFDLSVTVFGESWIPLPGGEGAWPMGVKANGILQAVVEHDSHPSVKLLPGTYHLEGSYHWRQIPQSILVPREIGILNLTLEGIQIESPDWDAAGILWFKRDSAVAGAEKDFLAVKLYALLEDGVPLWLRTQVELIVSGKSREEQIGSILPEGWRVSAISSPIPVAIDGAGQLKAQVRAGKWIVHIDAFRFDNPREFQYAPEEKAAVAEELIAFRAQPDFRSAEIVGAPSVDASQTTFPEKWRNFPLYRWGTSSPLRLEERTRGMGTQKPQGLKISRALWLDEGGGALSFRDHITGHMQEIWRLDAATGQDLGSVRSDGKGQLITRNPQNGAPGVEIRTRDIDLEATGRVRHIQGLSATGWRSDADALNVTLNLPPGWRLFALFGADWVQGDWLTSWTLLDLFLLLVFSLAVLRLWGIGIATLAFVALGLSYHEPGAPRYVWLILLMPLALLRVVPAGWGRRLVKLWKWLTTIALVLILAPFVARQVQQALYPQLEDIGFARMRGVSVTEQPEARAQESPGPPSDPSAARSEYLPKARPSPGKVPDQQSNLMYEADARIQTGLGVPEWTWRTVTFGWNGPVLAAQQVRPILISLPLERALTVLRVLLLLALASFLLETRKLKGFAFRMSGKSAAVLLLLWTAAFTTHARAQIPDPAMLESLRQRILEPSDAYPNAADIASVSLTLNDRRLTMDAEIHAASRTAVPLPGQLPLWSPLSVFIDGQADVTARREDGYLWVVLPEGVHHVRVEGLLANVSEWAWTFQLKPRRVTIEAPGWTFTGVGEDGVPEHQIFFSPKKESVAGQVNYDRQDLQSVVAVERHLELGLVWQVHTRVSRLSPQGKPIALTLPLLPDENVLSAGALARDGFIDVRLGANDQEFSWESELAVTDRINLTTNANDSWVERWHLIASPIWNVTISGLAPTFAPGNPELVPVWHPWPGESVEISISRPEAIPGTTVAVSRAIHEISLGKRQRVAKLDLALRCSVGQDFLVELPAHAEVVSLVRNRETIPVRKERARIIVPLQVGEQTVSISWKMNVPLGLRTTAGEVGLPSESANVNTVMRVPENRWILWTTGPLRGPAVRFWSILVCALVAGWILGRLWLSPLRSLEWTLLAIGLTQIPLPAALVVVGWLFFLVSRGRASFLALPSWCFNLLQLALIILTAVTLGIFLSVVAEGLLGNPEMFIVGNGSDRTILRWYQARSDTLLPRPVCISVSIWWYRFLMLTWALWLAASLIRWLHWAWQQFGRGGFFRRMGRKALTPPPVPNQS
jgi:hypothetical protein